jgi:outer membrane murein-binding lipoprotein Lpp
MRTSRFAARLLALSIALVTLLSGCETRASRARADSLQAITDRQLALTTSLSSQKDSLMRAILESDSLLSRIDSQIRSVKGLSTKKRVSRNYESPLEEQLMRRKELSDRVEALVQRARVTATELAESRKREQELRGKNDTLQLRIEDDQRIIAELSSKVQEQSATIASLELRVDSLITETKVMGERYYRAYYVIGSEDELIDKGIIQHEGGANFLLVRLGRTLQPARALDPELFTAIDRRDVREIPLPDTAKKYALVSRQNLDNAEVKERDKAEFRGHLRIPDSEAFWGTSRFLILVAK